MDEGQRIIIHSADSSQQQHKLFILFYFSLSFLKKNILRQQSEFNEWKTTDYSLFSLHFPLLNDGDSLLHTHVRRRPSSSSSPVAVIIENTFLPTVHTGPTV